MQPTKTELVEELLRLQTELKRQPTIKDIKEYSEFPLIYFEQEFSNFSKAKEFAFKDQYSKIELLDDLADLFEKLGRLPTRQDVRQMGKYPTFAYEKVFGTFTSAKQTAIFKNPENIKVYNDYWKLYGDFMLTSDWHLPYYDPDICEKMLAVSEKLGLNKLIIAGDFFNQDAFSHYLNIDTCDFGYEKNVASEILEILCQSFDEIYILTGNHDIRLLKLLAYKLKIEDVWKLVTTELGRQIKVTAYPYLRINDTWHITHPKNFSILPTSVARKMNHKYQMSIGVAHGHQMGITYSPSGTDVLFDTGGMFDQDKVEYSRMSDTTHCEWQTGFSVIRNNFLYQFPKKHTDWDFWLNELL
jgi:predicted phosphodiesterase